MKVLGNGFAPGYLEISICIFIVRRAAEIIGKEGERFEMKLRPAIGVKKNPNAIALSFTPQVSTRSGTLAAPELRFGETDAGPASRYRPSPL